jgi:YesN/AraC family two-component response regulator
MQTQKLLIVDDEVDMLEGLQRVLNYELKQVEVVVCALPSGGTRSGSPQQF